MSGTLLVRNHQRAIPLNARLLRVIAKAVLEDFLATREFDLGVHIVRAPEMACLNETFLQHKGPTDVITFDYLEKKAGASTAGPSLCGEIIISIDDALAQARQFHTTWPSEIVRYVIHGFLHLKGFDDTNPGSRRKMKRQENLLLKKVSRLFPLSKLAGNPKLRA